MAKEFGNAAVALEFELLHILMRRCCCCSSCLAGLAQLRLIGAMPLGILEQPRIPCNVYMYLFDAIFLIEE